MCRAAGGRREGRPEACGRSRRRRWRHCRRRQALPQARQERPLHRAVRPVEPRTPCRVVWSPRAQQPSLHRPQLPSLRRQQMPALRMRRPRAPSRWQAMPLPLLPLRLRRLRPCARSWLPPRRVSSLAVRRRQMLATSRLPLRQRLGYLRLHHRRRRWRPCAPSLRPRAPALHVLPPLRTRLAPRPLHLQPCWLLPRRLSPPQPPRSAPLCSPQSMRRRRHLLRPP